MKKLLLFVVLLALPLAAAQLPTGTITGEILNREGRPAPNVRVSAMAVPDAGAPAGGGNSLVAIGMTDEAGRYRLESVPPGRYYIVAGLVDTPTYYPGVPTTVGAATLNVLSGTPITGINFTMARAAGVNVSGRVVGPTGQPVPAPSSMRVNLVGGNGVVPGLNLQPDGSFNFSRVLPGNYQLMFSGALASTTQRVPILVGDNDITGLEVRIIPTVQLSGALRVEGDGLRPRTTITFMPLKGGVNASNMVFAGAAGRVVLEEGEYRVGWGPLPAGYELRSITAGPIDLLATNLKVTAASGDIPITVTLGVGQKPWVKVSGRVSGLIPLPNSSGFRIMLTGSLLADLLDVPINPDGSFEFSRVLPGQYSAVISPALPIALNTLVVPNQDVTNLSINVPPLKEVRGSIANSTGRILAFRITWNESTPTVVGTAGTIDADGRFSILLPIGERRVTMTIPGFAVQSLTYGSTDLLREPLKLSPTDSSEIRADVAPAVVGGVPGGVLGGVAGGVLGGILSGPVAPVTLPDGRVISGTLTAPPPPPPPPPPAPINRIGGDVAQANLISSVPPTYPPQASAARVQGVVLLQVQISREGAVEDIRVISGHALLNTAAIDAVRQWRYKPQMLNGQPIPVVTTVTVNFTLPQP